MSCYCMLYAVQYHVCDIQLKHGVDGTQEAIAAAATVQAEEGGWMREWLRERVATERVPRLVQVGPTLSLVSI